jgi:hypothetical protein
VPNCELGDFDVDIPVVKDYIDVDIDVATDHIIELNGMRQQARCVCVCVCVCVCEVILAVRVTPR